MRFPVTYNGPKPGANTNDYVLFTTAGGTGPQWRQQQIARFYLCLFNSASGTLKDYFSQDGGATWILRSTNAVSAASTAAFDIDYFVAPFKDWKLVWTNGGSSQTTFVPAMVMSTEQAAAI